MTQQQKTFECLWTSCEMWTLRSKLWYDEGWCWWLPCAESLGLIFCFLQAWRSSREIAPSRNDRTAFMTVTFLKLPAECYDCSSMVHRQVVGSW